MRKRERVRKSVVRPATMHAAQAWPVKKVHVNKLDVAQMRMLTFMCAVTTKKQAEQ